MSNIFVKANKLINFIKIFLIFNSQIWKFCRFNFLLRCVLACFQKSEANRKKLCQTPGLMVNFHFVLKDVSFRFLVIESESWIFLNAKLNVGLLRAVIFMVIGGVSIALMQAAVKLISLELHPFIITLYLTLIHICRWPRSAVCRSRWSPYH